MTRFAFGRPLVALVAAAGLIWLGIGEAPAQQKQKFHFKAPTGITKFTQQHRIEVGDRAGHTLGLIEAHTKYADEAPAYDGVKAVEMWNRTIGDITDGNGLSSAIR